jgi:hypothetical protein
VLENKYQKACLGIVLTLSVGSKEKSGRQFMKVVQKAACT